MSIYVTLTANQNWLKPGGETCINIYNIYIYIYIYCNKQKCTNIINT